MDVLSSVLKTTQTGSALLCQSRLLAPWGIAIEASAKVAIHVVHRHPGWLRIEDDPAILLMPGDVALVGAGFAHTVADAPGSASLPWRVALPSMRERLAIEGDAEDNASILLCAAYEFARGERHPLLRLLPRLIHLRAAELGRHEGLPELLRLLLIETTSNLPGADIVAPRLVDMLLVMVVRAWLTRRSGGPADWFAALADPQVGRALVAIHERPEASWSVEALAAQASLSRAAFARRFTALVGTSPLQYLRGWRMQLAENLLRDTRTPLADIAQTIGYESASSFGKAFRQLRERTPAEFRSEAQSRGEPAPAQ